LLVHLPTALWPAALGFDVATRFDVGGNPLVRAAFFAIVIGLISALVAVPAGLADWTGIKHERPAWKLGLTHLILNGVAVAIWAVNGYLRWDDWETAGQTETTPLLLSIAGTVVLLIAGYLGGRMVYDYGISVARQSKAEWREAAVAGRSRVPAEEG
jgi:uncharacterized membrane protein